MIHKGNSKIGQVYRGSMKFKEIYKGSELVLSGAKPSFMIRWSTNERFDFELDTNPLADFTESSINIGGTNTVSMGWILRITFGKSYYPVTSIPSSFFDNQTGTQRLIEIDLSGLKNVTIIGNSFLRNSELLPTLDLSMMKNLVSAGISFLNGCSALRTLKMGALTPPNITGGIRATNLTSILVPSGSEDAYKSHVSWSNFASIITGY